MIKSLKLLLFSFFLIPSLLFATTLEAIQKKIDNALSVLPANCRVGMLIYNPLTQDTVFQMNPDASMIPASNTKLFTTAAALSYLGGDFKLSTKILIEKNNLKNEIIDGNLYIKGYGNSTFTHYDLDSMVTKLKLLGIKEITGNVVGDDSYFDEVYSRDDWIRDEVANVNLPPISAMVIDRNKIVTRKRVRRRIRYYIKHISNPPSYVAQLLRTELIKNGITVNGTAVKGITPTDVTELCESTIILRDLIAMINKHSDNFLAECLFKTIGAEVSKKQGNSFYSTQAVLDFISDNNIFAKGTAVVDGSGISRFNQITPGAITGVLEKMYIDLPHYEDFYNSLSIAGVDGTLRHRMNGTLAENNFHGKTGTLNGVSSVSGYLTTKGDEDLVLSILIEFKRGGSDFYRDVEDKIIEILANWD